MTRAFGSWRHPTSIFLRASCTRLSLLRQFWQWTDQMLTAKCTYCMSRSGSCSRVRAERRSTAYPRTKPDQARERCREADQNTDVSPWDCPKPIVPAIQSTHVSAYLLALSKQPQDAGVPRATHSYTDSLWKASSV